MEEWQNPETLKIWILIIVLFVLLLLALITYLFRTYFHRLLQEKDKEAKLMMEQQYNILEASMMAQEKERKRIASDLHDLLISKLTVLKFKKQIENPDSEENELLMDCITATRRLSHDLSPPMIQESSLKEVIEEITLQWNSILNIAFREDVRHEESCSSKFKIQINRIVQEILTNAIKYSQSTAIYIHLRITKQFIVLYIADNGQGFSIKNKAKGLGLENIAARVRFLKGKHKIKSTIGKGTSFIATFVNQ